VKREPQHARPPKAVAVGILAVHGREDVNIFNGFTRADGGQIAVIRNGGPLDNRQFRQVVPPGSSLTWTGLFSQTHPYPGSQRFYTISADPKMADSGGVDVETVPTSDGVEIGLEATMYFDLNQDPSVLKPFDDKYGTRTYRDKSGAYHQAWDGDLGWSTFLDAVIRPVISNDAPRSRQLSVRRSAGLLRFGPEQRVEARPGR
jgi:hypothetical protein